jgi:hypothetical protein
MCASGFLQALSPLLRLFLQHLSQGRADVPALQVEVIRARETATVAEAAVTL